MIPGHRLKHNVAQHACEVCGRCVGEEKSHQTLMPGAWCEACGRHPFLPRWVVRPEDKRR